MTQSTFHPVQGWLARRRLLMGVVGALIIMSIVYFGAGVRAQLQGLAKANSDSVQWSMSQAEVEHLALLVAIKGATAQPEAGLDEVRKRFNIFYSRISTLEAGALYDDLRQLPDTSGNLNRLRAFLDRNVAFIDADDATLRANLPKITADTHNARAAIRDLSLQGISYFSEQKEQSRTGISRTLLSIAVLSTFLFALLCLLVMALNKLNRINQQRALQTELDSSRLSAIVGTSLDAVIVVSGHGRVIDFNGAAEEIFGYSRDDVIGQNMADLIIPDHLRAAHHAGMKRYHSDGSKHVVGKGRIRIEAKRKSGEVFPVELSIQEARGEDGEIFVSYIRDISKEVEAETELRTARDSAIAGETSKARLLAVMSHEMRTPLNGLLGTMELLSETPLTQKQERYLGIMGKSGRMLLSHVNEVLDVSLLDSGNMELQNMAFDLKELIGDVVDSQHAIAQAKGNSLVFDSDDPELLVSGDQNRIRKVIINLVGNAIKFTRNGQVAVELERLCDGNQCEIRVIDNGIGIAEENIERIFEDFTTLDSSYGRNAEGTGLGLGIVRRIVNALDGSIGVESEPGQGSLFWVRLPVGLPSNMSLPSTELLHGQAQATETKHTTGTQPLDILLVEDNEINRTIASEFLSVDGHRVVLANDGLEGIALANQRRFDLILMNISMPDIDGVEATGKIRADDGLSRETPIVALTAHALEEDIRRFKEAGMSDVISKPVSGSTLRDAVVKLASDQEMTYAEDEPEDLIDLEAIQELRQQLGEQKFSDIVNKFCAEMDEETPGIRIVDPSHADLETLAKTAHRLGGSAAVMGASELHRTLKQIEHSARCGDKQMQHAQILDVETAWHRTRALMLDQI